MTADAPAWALALLRDARVGRLATADATGQPLVVPVCYALDADGRHLYSAIDAKPKRTRQLRRLRNIAANPRVSLVVDEYDEDWSRSTPDRPGTRRPRVSSLRHPRVPWLLASL